MMMMVAVTGENVTSVVAALEEGEGLIQYNGFLIAAKLELTVK